jgi:hypothetical protein
MYAETLITELIDTAERVRTPRFGHSRNSIRGDQRSRRHGLSATL